MEAKKTNPCKRAIDKLFGGLNMSWPAVLLFAVGTAVLTVIFLLFPVFKNTSFEQMGITFEAWIFFAVIIMANCQKPLESALKTFVFFLISQPLIYLMQVPFSSLGWGLFQYYQIWFVWTLLTLPMAFIGWYITKRNWWSVLIFAPIFIYLGSTMIGSAVESIVHFPHLLVTALFCLLQIVLYVIAFFPKVPQKIVGILIPVATAITILVFTPQVQASAGLYFPDEPSFSAEAALTVEDASIADVTLDNPEEGSLFVQAHAYGTTTLTVTDGDATRQYTLNVYDDNGIPRIKVTPIEQEDSTEALPENEPV